MKKLFSVVSLLTCLGIGGFISTSSTVDIGATSEGEKTYIVTIDQGVNSSKADSTRNRVLNEIKYHLPNGSYTIDYVYSEVLNGFAITTDSVYEEYIGSLTGVASIEEEHHYAVPTATTSSTEGEEDSDYKEEKLENYSAETMEATEEDVQAAIAERLGSNASASDQDPQLGKGITIGIIDTGLYLNQIDGSDERDAAESSNGDLNAAAFQDTDDVTDVLTTDFINSVQSDLDGNSYSRYGKKIAFAYDYYGSDADVNTSSEHGTHVASLAAANGDDFQGIAPNAQLAIMKVFDDAGSGAYDSEIIAAIQDATILGLDIINLSLGTDLYDYDDDASNAVHAAIDDAVDAGVIVNYAAGNSGKSSFSGTKGYSDWTTDMVEGSFLGSEALYDEKTNIVASSNPDKAFYESIVTVNGNVVSYYDQVINRTGSTLSYDEPHAFTDLLGDASEGTFTYVRMDSIGNSASYQSFYDAYNTENDTNISSLDAIADTVIAVINRGDTTFQNKAILAENNGADALIVVNNEPSVTFNFNFDFNDYNPKIPIILVFQSTGAYFGDDNTVGELTIQTNQAVEAPDGNIVSSFSSDGPTYNLDIAPEIAAPGNSVIGAISATDTGSTSGLYGYDNLDGTSMATPNYSGGLATILSEFLPSNSGELALSDEEYEEYKSIVSEIVMSSADQLNDSTADSLGSVRLQGAGVINVADAIGNATYVTSGAVDDSQSTASSEAIVTTSEQVAKVELKNRGSLYQEDLSEDEEAYIEFSYTIHNDSDVDKTYQPNINLMIPQLQIQVTQADYDSSYENDPTTVADYAENFPGAITMSINDQTLDVPANNWETGSAEVTVSANSTYTGSVKVRIDNIEVYTEFDTYNSDDEKEVEDFSGTLREYFNEYFDDAGGSYVEGYFYLEETTSAHSDYEVSHTLSMPYLGFYGDYTKGEAVEPFQFEKEDGHLYNSELADAYLQNLSSTYAKTNCYTGSTLTATDHALTTSEISNISNLNTSAYQDGSNYLSVVQYDDDGNMYLKAGSSAASYLTSVFYVNRSVSEASWEITSQNGSRASSGTIYDIYSGYQQTGIGLVKSHIVVGSSAYAMHHGYASINLSDLAEGTYTLSFNFTLRGTGTTQTKSYTLVIDKTPPSLTSVKSSYNSSGRLQLTITTEGGDAGITYSGITVVPTKVDGEDDLYETTITLSDRLVEAETLNLTITDSAYNTINVIVHLSNLNCIVYGENVPSSADFFLTTVSQSGGVYLYDFVLTDSSGDDLTSFSDKVNLQLYVGTGLDADSLYVLVNNEDIPATQFSYDASTGYLTIYDVELDEGYCNITLNASVSTPSDTDGSDDPSVDDPGTDDPTDEEPTTPSEDPSDETPEESEGLAAWQIALIAVGAVVVVGAVAGVTIFFLKKKKA